MKVKLDNTLMRLCGRKLLMLRLLAGLLLFAVVWSAWMLALPLSSYIIAMRVKLFAGQS